MMVIRTTDCYQREFTSERNKRGWAIRWFHGPYILLQK